jgi:predicted Zn-dependent peptidase
MENFKKIRLSNGLRVLLIPQKKALASTVLLLVEAGSEYETKEINGLSHFLEHMCFKGTTNRPGPGQVSEELDALGSEYNAFTTHEYTGYWAKARSHKVENLMDIVSDLYLNPVFNPEEIDKERGVIIEEINMYEDTPMRRAPELFMHLLYGDQPAGWDIAGRKEIIRKLARNDFVGYREQRYIAPATVVAVAGDFDSRKMLKNIESRFGLLKRKPKSPKPKTIESQRAPAVTIKFKESDQTHLVLGTRAFSLFDKRRYAAEVLGNILGGGMSSRLFRKLRNEMGAAYYVRAGADLMIDHGFFAVSAGVDNLRLETVLKAILGELKRISTEKVDSRELGRMKEHLIGNFVLGLESSDEIAGYYGGQEILSGSIETPEQYVAKLNKVTAEAVQAVARDLFNTNSLNLALIGPYKDDASLKKLLKI